MPRSRWIPILIVSVAVTIVMTVPSLRGGSGAVARTASGVAEGRDSGPGADLARVETRNVDAGADEEEIEAPPVQATARMPASAIVEEVVEPEAPVHPVMGVVTDAEGAPVPGVHVTLESTFVQDFNVEIGSFQAVVNPPLRIDGGPGTTGSATTTTDAKGVFIFEGSDRERAGLLKYGAPILLGEPLAVCVDPKAEWQILRLPPFDAQRHVWTVEIVDSEGEAVAIDTVDLEFVRETDKTPARWPLDSARTVLRGSVEQRGLAAGTWRLHIAPRAGLSTTIEQTFSEAVPSMRSTIVVEVIAGGFAEVMGPSVTDEGESWVDPSTGILEWLPEDLLRVAESAENRHFAQTLRVGHGPVKAAELIVKMRATAFASENDGIYLEHLGKRSFAWGGAISDLFGRKWYRGSTTTLHLDLSRLPVKGEDPVDLRSYLEDGHLDVVVQDDTTIEEISVRVIR